MKITFHRKQPRESREHIQERRKIFMLPKVCVWTVITFTKNYRILPMLSNVTIKNVSWLHFSWATLYISHTPLSLGAPHRSGCITSSFWLQIKSCTNGDVVSRSGGFGITVSRTISVIFGWVGQGWLWTISSEGIISSDAVSSTTFQVAMVLWQHCLLQWFSDYNRGLFHYKRYFGNSKIQLRSQINNKTLSYRRETALQGAL